MNIENAIKTLRTLLPDSSNVNITEIESAIDDVLKIPKYADIERDKLITAITALYKIHIDDFTIIERKHEPWVKNKKAAINWQFWDRYRDYLVVP